MNLMTFLLFIVALIFFVVIVYAGLPNFWVRVLHQTAIRTIQSPAAVALTFDDGPDPNYTPRLLDALKAEDIRATFFVIAEKAVRRPDIIVRMLKEGHDVQVHGYKHWLVPFLTPRLTHQQVTGAGTILSSHFGIQTAWYRPTWGLSNAVTLLCRRSRSHRLVTWSVMVRDWHLTDPSVLLRRILAKLQPGGIIVLHDSDETWGAEKRAPESVIALIPELAAAVRAKGLTFMVLTEAMPHSASNPPPGQSLS